MVRRYLAGFGLAFAIVLSVLFGPLGCLFCLMPGPAASTTTERTHLVVAANLLTVGITVTPLDVKLVKIPADQMPKRGFSKIEDVVNRVVISNTLLDEPLLENRLAPLDASVCTGGPVVPIGMRAMAVKIHALVGGPQFSPGMRADVLVASRSGRRRTTQPATLLADILVLSRGRIDPPGAPQPAVDPQEVVLLVTVEQADMLTQAGRNGRIQLVVRK